MVLPRDCNPAPPHRQPHLREKAALHPRRVPGNEALRTTIIAPPAWPFVAPTAPGGVEADAADDGKRVTIFGVDGDPVAGSGFAEVFEPFGSRGLVEHAGVVQKKRNRARAIVSAIVKCAVSPTPNVRTPNEVVAGPDGFLHSQRGIRRRVAFSAADDGLVALHHRARLRRGFDRGVSR